MEQLMNQKEYEFFKFMQGDYPRPEYQLEFEILRGQIERSYVQAIQYETGRIWI